MSLINKFQKIQETNFRVDTTFFDIFDCRRELRSEERLRDDFVALVLRERVGQLHPARRQRGLSELFNVTMNYQTIVNDNVLFFEINC